MMYCAEDFPVNLSVYRVIKLALRMPEDFITGNSQDRPRSTAKFFLENVKNYRTHEGGRTLSKTIQLLEVQIIKFILKF